MDFFLEPVDHLGQVLHLLGIERVCRCFRGSFKFGQHLFCKLPEFDFTGQYIELKLLHVIFIFFIESVKESNVLQ